MKYYIVKYEGDWADEFGVYFHSVIDEDTLAQYKKAIKEWEEDCREFGFGTNESIEVSKEEILECLDNARELTKDEYEVLSRLDLLDIGFGDGLNFDYMVYEDEE